jgi:hypothetical protein
MARARTAVVIAICGLIGALALMGGPAQSAPPAPYEYLRSSHNLAVAVPEISCPTGKFVASYASYVRDSGGAVVESYAGGAELRSFSGAPSLPQSILLHGTYTQGGYATYTQYVDVLCATRP